MNILLNNIEYLRLIAATVSSNSAGEVNVQNNLFKSKSINC